MTASPNQAAHLRMKPRHRLIWIGIGASLLLAVTLFASRPIRSPDRSRIVGVWSGYSDHSDFLRFELDDNGTGYLSIGYNSSRTNAALYRVQAWKYSDWKVELTTTPIDAEAEPVAFTNFIARSQYAECTFGGHDWTRKAKLFSESEWKVRSMPLQERVARYRKERR